MKGYSITEAPLGLKNKVIVGVAGGEFGIRGYIDAYDAQTGKRLWRFYTVPDPGQFGNKTWAGDSWKHGSGAAWMTGSYDPELNLLYWAVGNPGPDLNAAVRQGDNLFTCSVVALNPDTGTWNRGFRPNGRPILSPGWKSSPEGNIVAPTLTGGAEWQSPSYDPVHSVLYVVAEDTASDYRSAPANYEAGREYMAGGLSPVHKSGKNGIVAIDTKTGRVRWL